MYVVVYIRKPLGKWLRVDAGNEHLLKNDNKYKEGHLVCFVTDPVYIRRKWTLIYLCIS